MSALSLITGLAEGTFGVGTYQTDGGKPFPGLVLADGAVIDLSNDYVDTHAVFADWDRALDLMARLEAQRGRPELRFSDLRPLPVVAHPNILGAGSNYRQHVAEMMTHNDFNQHRRLPDESTETFFQRNLEEVDRRAREGVPFIWPGLHSALAGANDNIELPLIGEQGDWELELGVLTTGRGRYLRPDEAGDLIAAYVMVNDLGMVDTARRTDVRFEFDWLSKSQAGFFTCGPFAVPKEFVDTSRARIQLKINGEVMQDWPVDDMIFSPEQMLSYASERVRLMPGDLLICGSPPGNAAMHGRRWLRPGDVVESEITGLGRQRNKVVAEEVYGRTPTFGMAPCF